jgi:hypothetical protein
MVLICLLTTLFFNQSILHAQTPGTGIFFQAIARDQYTNPAKDRKIYVEASIIQSTVTGTKVLIETHQTTTDGSGVFSISVGQGARTGGTVTSLDKVQWAKGPYYLNLKISITPIAPIANWDYTKDWIDLGTSPFGTVPYALYSGSSGALDDKLSIADTSKMLAIYAKAQIVNSLSTQVNSKLSVSDTTTMLAPYAKMVNELVASNITSLTAATVNAALNSKVNVADSGKVYVTPLEIKKGDSITKASLGLKLNVADSGSAYVTPLQLKGVTFDTTSLISKINKKINLADSTTVFVTPLQLAAKTFDSTAIYTQLGTKLNKVDTTVFLRKTDTTNLYNRINLKANSTDVTTSLALKLNKADTSFLLQKTDTATLSNRINLKANSADVTSGLALKLNITDTSVLLRKADTSTLSNRINLKANTTDVTSGLALKLDVSQRGAASGVASLDINSKVPASQIPVVSFQSANVVATEAAMLGLSSAVVGSIAIRTDVNRNFILSGANPAVLANWVELAVPTSVTTINGIPGAYVTLTTNEIGEGATNKYYTDTRARNAISASGPLNYNASAGTLSITAASGSSNGYLTATDFTTFNNKQNALVAGTDYATPSGNITGNAANVTGVVSIVNGGTGTTTATGALTTLGAEARSNKSTATDLGNTNPSDNLYPSQKAVKTYVDLQSANAGVADLSITNAKLAGSITADKLNGSIPASKLIGTDIETVGTITSGIWSATTIALNKGGTGATTAADARTNLGLVIGTNVMAANAITTLTGDVAGSGNGSFATTVNSVGGVSSATIATLPTSVAANTLSITNETTRATNAESALDTRITSNTTSITANTTSITNETTRATNAESALDTRITSNTTSITANTTSINNETTRATNAESALDTRITSNTTSITTNTNNISTNTADILLKAPIASPAFTGVPTAPTPATSDNSTKVATTEYVKASITAANAGISSIGDVSNTSNAKGAVISGTTQLILTPADANFAGIVTTATQTFAGAKTFTNTVTFGKDIKVNGMTIGRPANPFASNTQNIAIGNNVMGKYAPTAWTTDYNIGIGYSALFNLTNGGENVAIGSTAMYLLSSGDYNTGVGSSVMTLLTTGNNNTVLGTYAGSNISSGSDNTFIGSFTGSGVSGSNNILIGSNKASNTNTGTGITTGSNNTIIGSGIRSLPSTLSNNIILADGAGNIRAQHDGTNGWALGTITSGVWSGTAIANNKLANSTTTLGSTTMTLGGTVTSVTGLTSLSATNLTGALTGNASTATALATGRTISTSGDITYTSGSFDGTADVTGVATLAASGVASGTYGSSTAIPTFTVDSKGRLTAASTVGITAGVSSLNYTTTTSYAAGGTISGTSLTLAAADATNPGLISTGAQTIAGAKTFNNDITATNFIGNLTGNVIGNATTASTAGNITATSNSTLTALSALNTVGTITTGVWSGTAIANNKLENSTTTLGSTTMTLGGTVTSVTGLTSLSATNLTGALTGNASTATALATGRTISTSGDITYISGNFDGTGDVTGVATLAASGVASGTYGSSTAIPTFTVDSKGRLTAASTVGITAGVSTLNYTTTTSYATGGTISGTSLTLSAADGINPGLISTGTQTIAGAKTFSSNIIGNLTGNATTATTAGNITATSNSTITSLSALNTVGTITTGTWSASVIGSNVGGAGTVNGLMKANGSGIVSAAVAGSDYQAPITLTTAGNSGVATFTSNTLNIPTYTLAGLGGIGLTDLSATAPLSYNNGTGAFSMPAATSSANGYLTSTDWTTFNNKQTALTAGAGSGISISGGTISATGLTTANLSSTAGITVDQLATKTTTLGSTTMTLGGTVTSVTGLTSVSSTGFTGALTGNASTATALATGRTISTTGDVTYTSGSFDGTGNVTGVATLAASGVSSGTYGSSTTIPVLTVDTKGRVTTASSVSITAGVNTVTAIAGTSNANGATISGTSITLTPADATNGGILTAGTQTIGGAKTFSNTTTFNSDITVNGLTIGKGAKNVASNTVIGISALKSTNAGSEIVAIGNNSLQAGNNSGSNLTSVGSYSGYYNSTGSNNSFFGYKAGFNNTTGLLNTAVGAESMGYGTATGYGNTALGYRSLYRVTEGYGNSAVGDSVLIANTSGYYNVGVGHQTLESNLSGYNNIGLGYNALNANTTGYSNIGIGRSAIYYNQTGNYNIGIGEQTLERLTGNTSNNIAIGFRAGKYFGTGTSINVASSIAGNLLIGYDVRVNGASDVNQIVIAGYTGTGEGQIGLGTNSTSIGNASTQQSRIYGALTVSPNTATGAGNSSTIAAQNAGGTNTAGGALNLTAGNAGTTGLGGNIVLTPGTSTTAANNGIVKINGQVQITGGSPAAGEVLTTDANGLASWTYSIGSTVVTSTSTYAITLAEAYVFYTGGSAGAFTIPAAASGNAGKTIVIKNKTAFGITITPASGTIYIDSANTGAASVSIGIEASNNWIKLVSDGSQWNVFRALF